MRVLIVKLTSMGDLVQALPALSDARAAIADIQFDWVVDEAFAEIPRWHPTVNQTLETAHRRWRRQGKLPWQNSELLQFRARLRSSRYDIVIDAQNNFKSALVTALSRGEKHGPDSHSVREWGAHLAYRKRYQIPRNQLAIDRWRQLFARVLGYDLPTREPDFGLAGKAWPEPACTLPAAPYLVFVQNASWPNKRWHDQHWRTLLEQAGREGYRVLLPWGSEAERQQAQSLVQDFDHARVLPRLSLSQLAAVFSRSAGAVCVDTGLAHLSAALAVPTVTLYGATDPALIGATGSRASHLVVNGYDCAPCYKRLCKVDGYRGPDARCMKTLPVDQVWRELRALMDGQTADLLN